MRAKPLFILNKDLFVVMTSLTKIIIIIIIFKDSQQSHVDL